MHVVICRANASLTDPRTCPSMSGAASTPVAIAKTAQHVQHLQPGHQPEDLHTFRDNVAMKYLAHVKPYLPYLQRATDYEMRVIHFTHCLQRFSNDPGMAYNV